MTHRACSIVAGLFLAPLALAQGLSEDAATRIQMQVFNPTTNSWASALTAAPGSQVEWRVTVSYTGTNTNVFALGGLRYQPTFSNADNIIDDNGVDELGPWRNGGVQGSAIPDSMLTAAEGETGGPLASYGRVIFGGTTMSGANALATHRHGGSFPINGAPADTWLRVGTTTGVDYPTTPVPLQPVSNGVLAGQQATLNPVTQLPNTFHVSGSQQLVMFRGAFIASGAMELRQVTLDIPAVSLIVAGSGPAAATWQTGNFDPGSWRTGVTIEPATITIPEPTAIALVGLAALPATRRRR